MGYPRKPLRSSGSFFFSLVGGVRRLRVTANHGVRVSRILVRPRNTEHFDSRCSSIRHFWPLLCAYHRAKGSLARGAFDPVCPREPGAQCRNSDIQDKGGVIGRCGYHRRSIQIIGTGIGSELGFPFPAYCSTTKYHFIVNRVAKRVNCILQLVLAGESASLRLQGHMSSNTHGRSFAFYAHSTPFSTTLTKPFCFGM